MRRINMALATLTLVVVPTMAIAALADLRITEVDPDADQVEIINTGGAFNNTASRPFCHLFNYVSVYPSGAIAAGAISLHTVSTLHDTDSDLFLYENSLFTSGASIIHGVKYGPNAFVGRAPLAASVGLWTSAVAFAPAPPTGMTLAYDMFGTDPKDWYIDETPTMGTADATTPGTVPSGLGTPSGSQDFESMLLGDEVIAITDWVVVNSSATTGIFTVRCVGDVNGVVTPRNGSTQWLRVRDQDAGNVQNRFYTSTVTPASEQNYTWTWYVNLEETPPAPGGTLPRLVIQHFDVAFQNAWGIEFSSSGASLVVTGIGGTPASTSLYTLTGPTAVGQWVKLALTVDFPNNTVAAAVNDVATASLPISPAGSVDKQSFRFCFRGEGTGNTSTMLIDDVEVETFDAPTGVRPVVAHATLGQNYPNPFNPSTTIEYVLPIETNVTLSVYDTQGRQITRLFDGTRSAGPHTLTWDGRDSAGVRVSSGTYFYRLVAGEDVLQRKMLLLK